MANITYDQYSQPDFDWSTVTRNFDFLKPPPDKVAQLGESGLVLGFDPNTKRPVILWQQNMDYKTFRATAKETIEQRTDLLKSLKEENAMSNEQADVDNLLNDAIVAPPPPVATMAPPPAVKANGGTPNMVPPPPAKGKSKGPKADPHKITTKLVFNKEAPTRSTVKVDVLKDKQKPFASEEIPIATFGQAALVHFAGEGFNTYAARWTRNKPIEERLAIIKANAAKLLAGDLTPITGKARAPRAAAAKKAISLEVQAIAWVFGQPIPVVQAKWEVLRDDQKQMALSNPHVAAKLAELQQANTAKDTTNLDALFGL